MKRTLIGFLLFLCCLPLHAQKFETNDSVVARLVLIGDAGDLKDGHHPVVEAVEKLVPLDKKTTVIYLGDNLYRHGLPDELVGNYLAAKAVLDSQANIADHSKGMVYFIPGNHDWMNGAPGGYEAIVRQQRYLDRLGKKNLKFYPEDGCPGPVQVDIGDDVVLVMMDSQWWLHQNDKPGIESDCAQKTVEEVLSELRGIVAANYKKLIIFACHHPFKSYGVHGGYYTIKQHIFPLTDMNKKLYIPLPIIGSVYPISRGVFGTQEDIHYPAYQNMIAQVDEVLRGHPHVIHVAGHEHALEWIADSANHYIVSGSGSRTNRVSRSKHTKFYGAFAGFALLDVYKNKMVRCTFVGAGPDSVGKVLYSDTVFNYSRVPQPKQVDSTQPVLKYRDKVVVAASNKYKDPSAFQKLMIGHNYRKEWSTPVTLKEFNINTEKGGLKIDGAGGGMQTKTLHLKDKQGRRWNLRSIDKDPEQVLPPNMRGTFAKEVVQDEISAAYPYAPLAVAPLADAAGIVEANPEFFFVPDDPALGYYRPMFANTVCLLEQGDPTDDNKRTKSTAKVITKMLEENDHFIEQREVLRARMLDMMIGDWDRHFDQWHWGVVDTGRGKLYYPIPRDRDQAFFNSDGLVLRLASRTRLKWMKGFKSHYRKFNWLGYSARDFDRIFLNRLDQRAWEEVAKDFVATQTDSVIRNAVNQMPPEIVAISGDKIIRKLRSRRDALPAEAIKYYRFISKTVNVLGSNRHEYFTVKKTDTGILVQIHAKEKDTSLLMYTRTFDPKVTKELRLWGFNGNDIFDIDENVHTHMRVRIIGGRGEDTFNIKGRANTYVYDVSTQNNPVLAKKHTEVFISPDVNNNQFKLQNFQYSFNRYPSINLGYNPDDGVLAGLGVVHRTYGFRKDPFSSEQRLNTLFSPSSKAYQIKYRASVVGFYKGLDLVVNADLQNPALYNFYGLGNNTEKADSLNQAYYRARFNYLSGDLMLQKRPFKVLSIAAGPTFYYYWNHRSTNADKVLERPELVGLDSNDIFEKKTYLGGKINVLVDNLNSELFPTRGLYWNTGFTALQPLTKVNRPLTEVHSDMTLYASLADPAKLVAVLRTGFGHIFSKDFEYFQAESIGANNYLRGFRKNRFSGRSMAYGSIELRAKVADISWYVMPGDFGVLGFDDIARVWNDGENSRRWHNAYGAGVYFLPFNMFILSGSVAFSNEETLFNLTIGTRLNLTF